MSQSHIMPTYNRQPITFTRGQGSWLYTQDNTAYLDALTGIAVCGLGHCHPAISHAIAEQANTLIHTSNLYGIDWQERSAEALCIATGMDSVFFANSGAEANECALKLARRHAHNKGLARPKVIVMEKSFHGRTLLTVSATANPKAREGFYTLDEDFIRVPFGDIEAIKAAAQQHDDICAILLEPIQGEGGLNTVNHGNSSGDDNNDNGFGYLEDIAKLCDQHDWLFMLDEVQTGNGRTGKYFAHQHSNVKPDVLTTAKGLGNGFPVGACLVSGRAKALFGAGAHGSTYGGSPLACRVVYSVYEVLANTEVMQNVTKESTFIRESLQSELAELMKKGKIETAIQTRGAGMMIGVVLPEDGDYSQLVDTARDQEQLITNVVNSHVVRLLPPLNIRRDESEQLVEKLVKVIEQTLTN